VSPLDTSVLVRSTFLAQILASPTHWTFSVADRLLVKLSISASTCSAFASEGGINGEQAREIVGGLSAAGYTGEEGQNLAFNAIAPLVQQGQNAGITVGMMDQAIRNGNMSAKEFVDTMNDLVHQLALHA
jgi:hypothetical protein